MLECLAHMHLAESFAHNNLKGDKILLTVDLGAGQIRLKLFGMADMSPVGEWSTEAPGMAEYMAPERNQGRRHSAEKADIFSLGVTILTLLFLAFPFGNGQNCTASQAYNLYFDTPRAERNPAAFLAQFSQVPLQDVDLALAMLALEMIDRDPTARPSMAQIVASELYNDLRMRELLHGHPELFTFYTMNIMTD